MPQKLHIPNEMLKLYPHLTINEIRTIIKTILNAKSARLRHSYVFRVVLPHLGVMRSHGLKKPKSYQSMLAKDRKKKELKQRKMELTKEHILW